MIDKACQIIFRNTKNQTLEIITTPIYWTFGNLYIFNTLHNFLYRQVQLG